MVQIDDIINADLCVGCGACISESKGSFKMRLNKSGFFIPERVSQLKTDSAKVCPFNPSPIEDVKDVDKLADIFMNSASHLDESIGRFNNIYVGYSEKYRATSSSGGIGTFIMEHLLKNEIVDRLFVVGEVNGSYKYKWIEDYEKIVEASKTRYYPVTMEQLFDEIENYKGKVAVSAVPSFLKAIRLKQFYHPELREKIVFLIGIICGGLKGALYTDYLAQKAGIRSNYSNQEYRIKDVDSIALDYSFGAFDDNQEFHKIKMKSIGDTWGTGLFNANAYDFADDVTAELADISLGDAWLNPYKKDGRGTNVVVTRSKLAESLILDGVENNEVDLKVLSLNEFKASQAGGIRHMQKGLKFRLKIQKEKFGIVPFVRQRLLIEIPFEYKLVQKQRMKLRQKSIEIWNNVKDVTEFEREMLPLIKKLKEYTKFYHRIQRIRKIIGFKQL